MHVAALRIDLRIPDTHSLKHKRSKLKALMTTLSKSQSIAVAEVDHQDLWQRATLGAAIVSSQLGHLDRVRHSLERQLEAHPEFEVLQLSVSYLEQPE